VGNPVQPTPIIEEKILIVEGKDEQGFFEQIIDFQNLVGIQVLPVGGKEKIQKEIKAIRKTPGFEKVTDIGIIRDADDNWENAFKSVCGALKAAGLPVPTKPMEKTTKAPFVQLMILPNNHDPGELEDVCLEAIDERSLNCVNEFLNCMKNIHEYESKKSSISKIYAYLACKRNPRLRLGESAKKKYWDMNNQAFTEITKFLKSI